MMRVFLVDDSKSVRARIRVSIEELGACVVGEAACQEEAISGIVGTRPDLAIIDLRLRRGTGLNVLKHLKQQVPDTATIVLTNQSKEDYQMVCVKAGADYFLEKTRQYGDFIELLRQMNEHIFPTV